MSRSWVLVVISVTFLSCALKAWGGDQVSAPIVTSQLAQSISKNEFTVDRGLADYVHYFGPEFKADLDRLTADSHWIDGGSGNAYAQRDYLGSRDGSRIGPGRARLTAITYVYPKSEPSTLAGGRFRVLSGRYFEDIPVSEIPKADLITDLSGIMYYTFRPDITLRKYVELLKKGGKAYIFLPRGTTLIEMKSGKRKFFVDWADSLPGVLISEIYPNPDPILWKSAFVIRKGSGKLRIPELVPIFQKEENGHLYRIFREK